MSTQTGTFSSGTLNNSLTRHKFGKTSFLEGGAGEPFLLLHGIPGSAYTWEAVGARLATHYRVIAPDLLGFGQSEIPEGDYYMEAQANSLRQLLSHLDVTRLYLAGHDFGGPVSLTLMRLFPDLEVTSLVLSDTNLFIDTYIPPPLRVASVPVLNTVTFKMMAGNRFGLWLMYVAATRNRAEATWEKFARHLTPSGMEFTWRIFQRSLADLKTTYRAIQTLLPSLKMPTLLLWGANDPFFAVSVAERSQRTIPTATLKVYERTGHFVPEEQPQRVADEIANFIN